MTEAPPPHDEAAEPAASAFDRTTSPVAGRLGAGRAGKAVALAALVAGCGVFVAATWKNDKPRPAKAPVEPARQVVAFEPLSPPTLASANATPPSLTDTAVGAQVPPIKTDAGSAQGAPSAIDQAAQQQARVAAIRGAPILAYSRTSGASAAAPDVVRPIVPAIQTAASADQSELDELRTASTVGQARATRLPDRNFLIIAGSAIACTLQTAMDTATPGYVTCLTPRDVLSDNGAVVLMEKGTRVLGEYRSNLRQGQRRLYVLWTRAVTPSGVAINLASPAADPLGRAGFDGDIDSHFWDRFGGALLLSIVDDAAGAIPGRDTLAPSGAVNARLPSDAAGIALQNSVNIPPSLRKAQGAEVSIFVAQDFDFSGVYSLKAR